jgi:hypothetical protein
MSNLLRIDEPAFLKHSLKITSRMNMCPSALLESQKATNESYEPIEKKSADDNPDRRLFNDCWLSAAGRVSRAGEFAM